MDCSMYLSLHSRTNLTVNINSAHFNQLTKLCLTSIFYEIAPLQNLINQSSSTLKSLSLNLHSKYPYRVDALHKPFTIESNQLVELTLYVRNKMNFFLCVNNN